MDQRIVEAANIALAIWLTRDMVWAGLSTAARRRIVAWLVSVNDKVTKDNNWHLLIVLVNAILAALGEEHHAQEMANRYQRFKSFYRGNGWYSDGLQIPRWSVADSGGGPRRRRRQRW